MVYISKGSHTLFTNTIGGLHMDITYEEKKEQKRREAELIKRTEFYNMAYCLSHTITREQFREHYEKIGMFFYRE